MTVNEERLTPRFSSTLSTSKFSIRQKIQVKNAKLFFITVESTMGQFMKHRKPTLDHTRHGDRMLGPCLSNYISKIISFCSLKSLGKEPFTNFFTPMDW